MREGNGAEMALGSWDVETLKPSLHPGCCRGFHKALGASERAQAVQGKRGRGLFPMWSSQEHTLLPALLPSVREHRHVWGNRGKEGIIPWPFQHRGGEMLIQRPSKATSPLPQRPQGQGSRRVQGRGEAAALRLARGEAAPSGTSSSWLCLLAWPLPTPNVPHHPTLMFSMLVLPTESLKLGKTLKIEPNH